jgi:hypothetical protein
MKTGVNMLHQDTINLIQNLSKGNKDFDDNVKAFLTFGGS